MVIVNVPGWSGSAKKLPSDPGGDSAAESLLLACYGDLGVRDQCARRVLHYPAMEPEVYLPGAHKNKAKQDGKNTKRAADV